LYEAAVRQLIIRHPNKHEETYHRAIEQLLFADDARSTQNNETEPAMTSLAPWHFPRLRRLSYLHCGAWCDDANNHSAAARRIAALLARCGPSLASVDLSASFACYRDRGLAVAASAAASGGAPNVLPAAALLELARRTRLEELECTLVLRKGDMDAVCAAVRRRRFSSLRKLHACVKSRSAVRSLVAMVAGVATTVSAAIDVDGGCGYCCGEEGWAASALTELQLKMERRDAEPFAHLLAPLGRSLRDLRLVVAHPPGHVPLVAGADLAALGQLTQLRALYIEATTSDGGSGGAEDDQDDHELQSIPHDTAARPLPPTDTHMLALVAPLTQLESLHLELAESAFSAHVHADIGRCCTRLTRLRVPAPLDFDVLPRTGPPLFPVLEDLFARNVPADHAFETR
jgi:hypothetical protein